MAQDSVARKRDESATALPLVAAGEARERMTELLNRAAYGGERFGITRNGKLVGAIIGPDDLERLDNAA